MNFLPTFSCSLTLALQLLSKVRLFLRSGIRTLLLQEACGFSVVHWSSDRICLCFWGQVIWLSSWLMSVSVSWSFLSDTSGSNTTSGRSYCLDLATPLPSSVCSSEGLSLSDPQTCVPAERLCHLQASPSFWQSSALRGTAWPHNCSNVLYAMSYFFYLFLSVSVSVFFVCFSSFFSFLGAFPLPLSTLTPHHCFKIIKLLTSALFSVWLLAFNSHNRRHILATIWTTE